VLVTEKEETWIRIKDKDADIESLIIPQCVELHQRRIEEGALIEDPGNESAIEE